MKNYPYLLHAILLIGLIFTGSNAFSQSDDDSGEFKRFYFGIKGGYNLNSFEVNQSFAQANQGYRTLEGNNIGFSGGLFTRYNLSDAFGVQLEALFMQQGGLRSEPGIITGGIKNSRVTLHNAEVPLLFDIAVLQVGSVTSRFLTGGAIAYNIRSTQSFSKVLPDARTGGTITVSGKNEVVTDQYRDIQYGAYAGIRMDALAESRITSVEIRYRFGIDRVNELRFGTPFDASANTLSINLGVGF